MEPDPTRVLVTTASALGGLAVGSFLNVVIWRLPRGESVVHPPSHCPSCGTQLGAVENIPLVSWIAQRGRCRHCGVAISVRYPAVELVTAALFVGLALAVPSVAPLPSLDTVAAVTVAAVAIDLDRQRTPPVLSWIALGAAATLVAVSLAGHSPARLGWAGLAALVAVAAWALHVVTRAGGGAAPFPGAPWCAAWGFAAGWTGRAGGLAVGALLASSVLVQAAGRARWRAIAACGAGTILAIVLGAAVTF